MWVKGFVDVTKVAKRGKGFFFHVVCVNHLGLNLVEQNNYKPFPLKERQETRFRVRQGSRRVERHSIQLDCLASRTSVSC